MPDTQAPRSNVAGSKDGGTTSGGVAPNSFPTASQTNWNYLGANAQTITINNSNLNTAHLIGSLIENFLSSSVNYTNANYCLVSDYSLGGITYQLRSRIVPIAYYDFTAKRTVRIMRVDFPDSANSASFCSGTLSVKDVNGSFVTEAAPSSINYIPSTVCPTCTSVLTSSKVRLFQKTTSLKEVAGNLINLSSLHLLLDPNNNAGNVGASCTTSLCQSRGFDCCLDNQCVDDGKEKPSARTQYSSLLDVAEAERLTNPLAYLQYPQLYYICGSTVPSTTGGSTGGTSYDAGLELLKKDYSCIESLKSQSSSSPFQNEILSRLPPNTYTYTASANCPSAASYRSVVERLYTNCGCAQTTLEGMIPNCPAYDYVVAASSGGIPTRIECVTPAPETTPLPLQSTVYVSSRSAPHRFFDNLTGAERQITTGETSHLVSGVSTEYVQEGTLFQYLDDAKVVPDQREFSMNAILGQMKVSLDQALPAKSITVELDQVYHLTTVSGLYTPCPGCAKDSWINALSAFPTTNYGIGLQAIGHTVSRESLSTNSTGGNYEDTLFGRACWLPPTMIPFTHNGGTRANRLEAQAALFVNGYQRDWFGFNRGALIGSFDGVSWFAIGKGRIVKATSKKLHLAINAPFADLAIPNMHTVNVVAYNGSNKAALLDFDPALGLYAQEQNQAGSCQANHLCETDTECVTKLGWEYMCADVRNLKTNWPKFNENGNGNEVTGLTNITIDQILQQKKFPSGSSKRCVYRGAGAPCKVDSTILTDLNQKKLLTCAPNFYCANLNSSGLFNSRIARYAAPLEDLPVSRNHYFGKDANILGRPFNYLTGTDSTLPSTVAAAIRSNFSNDNNTGLCQPGKSLPQVSNEKTLANPFTQQQFTDPSRRTDFISQIGGCNSTLFTEYRYSSCPVINSTTGNYDMFENTFSTLEADLKLRALKARNQNSCGLDSLATTATLTSSADTLLSSSPFRTIEAKTLNAGVVTNATFARDACLRRAGQVCHTNLDCGPSRLHAEQVDNYPLSLFGNLAEKTYYSESLICGQTDPVPQPSSIEAFKNYDMSKNRCCREVGSDLTTYTSNISLVINPGSSTGDLSKYDPASAGLLTSITPALNRAPGMAPNHSKRYSRLATVENLGSVNRPYLTSYQNRNAVTALLDSSTENVQTPHQWKTLNEANSETCCGGGWIRKFSDGGNDWSKRDRLVMDVSNFSCLNSRTVLLTHPQDLILAGQYTSSDVSKIANDYGDYCKDGTNTKGSCAQYSISDSLTDTPPSNDDYTTATINTANPSFSSGNLDNFFAPRSADANSAIFIDYAAASPPARRTIAIKLPSFVRTSTISNAQFVSSDGLASFMCGPNVSAASGTCAAGCCYDVDATTKIMKVALSGMPVGFTGKKGGISFDIITAGAGAIDRDKPGSNSYYLRRLGRLELAGIPQVSHEALYCSDNSKWLIPGIFNPAYDERAEFQSAAFSYQVAGTYFTNAKALQNEPVFSANDFKCCTPLGNTANAQSKCCSGFGRQQGSSSNYTCVLPSGTDLMVYFNRFVSNEGVGSDEPGGGLLEADFDQNTGEPLLSAAVNQKISDLGLLYCNSGKVRQGGAFGAFEPEPQGPDTNLSSRIYNLVDSANDNGVVSNAGRTINTGYTAFTEGFRWNHHLYCDD